MFLDELERRSEWDSPWGQLRGLQERMNRLFENAYRPGAGFPALNVWTSDDSAVVTAEVPGMDPERIDISVTGNTLTMKGERKVETAETEEVCCHRQERPDGGFFRSVELPFRAESGWVEAFYKNGILNVKVPRAAEDKPRKIVVKEG